ncbi:MULTISPECIES: hypothetical protein [unclassified Brucella]|uniref:hypothetical protein n=1 Tax=unclassified Brucella TaxID=2632610 RepID=UPI0012ADB0E2|nr:MULTISPECIES: hypothetical protein [unclassified Brucella]MRN43956.1 hypothetical protein [Brucella sp. 09RB8913]MRN57450.1 hypothetical protein [Brucella sp. 09RB8918]
MSTSHRNKRKPLQPDCLPNIHPLPGTIRIVIPSAFSARWISLVFKRGNSPHVARQIQTRQFQDSPASPHFLPQYDAKAPTFARAPAKHDVCKNSSIPISYLRRFSPIDNAVFFE